MSIKLRAASPRKSRPGSSASGRLRSAPGGAVASKAPTAAPPARQVEGFIAKFDPKIAALIKAARTRLRKLLPTAHELVYDNYNFFVIGYSASERPSDCIVSLAANAKGIGLSFYNGASLLDPKGLLQGSGNQNRFIRLPSADVLDDPDVLALISTAIARSKTPLPKTCKGRTIVRSVSEKQRPRR